VNHVIVLVFLLGTINAFDIPVRQAFLINMVKRENLMSAIALNSAAFNGARMVGPILAGIIISFFGIAACFFFNAASYLATVITLSLINAKGTSTSKSTNVLKDIAEGIGFIRGETSALRSVLLVSVFSLFALPFVSQLPVFAEETFKAGARGLGLLMGVSGAGAFIGALAMAYVGDIKDRVKHMSMAALLFPALLFIFSLTDNLHIATALMFVTGVCVVLFLANANSVIQLCTPDGLRGRVMSVYTLLFLGMTPIGHTLMGLIANAVGPAQALRMTSSTGIVLSFIILFMTRSK
jgi:MFS family permease